jgi:hypothetical protein
LAASSGLTSWVPWAIGLHFGGRYLEANQAVALWKLIDDPLLKKAEVRFG